jgi:hypothetical protein
VERALGVVAAVVLLAGDALGAVRVERDEVIFTLEAPSAREVYLVGDFNQWNATVEPMAAVDGRFEVRLFLVAGTYRYKFVVDGNSIVDPDNPGPAERGSPLVLIERSGGLLLETDLPDDMPAPRPASYAIRYIGQLFDDDGDTNAEQRVDAEVRATLAKLRARALVATQDSSWDASAPSLDAFFDRGFVEVEVGRLALRGFENDSTWASHDPMGVVGSEGVYAYDAGYRYHGATAEAAGSHAAIRARWADETSRGPTSMARVDPADLSAFANGTSPDTSAYAYTYSFDGSDAASVEVAGDAGAFAFGYVFRSDRGTNPGVWVDVARRPTEFAVTTYATREDRNASDAWLRWNTRAKVTMGYGWGGIRTHAFASASGTEDLSAPIDASAALTPVEVARDLLSSDRFVVDVASEHDGASLRWDYTRFDFDGVQGTSRAEVHRTTLAGARAWRGVELAGSVALTSQRYRETPDPLHVDWPERNPWLSQWDALDVPSMVGIGLDDYTVWRASAHRADARVGAGGEAVLEAQEVFGAAVHASVRAWVDAEIRGGWYAYGDGRCAWYDRDAWEVDEAFLAGYLEFGYRNQWVQASLGVGLDPWQFDTVVGAFADRGRSEFLRTAIGAGVRRSEADALGRRLVERERALEDFGVIKLECVLELD